MTFEEWVEYQNVAKSSDYHGFEVIELMREAWNAAKEDSKEAVTVEWSELVEDWSIRDFRGAAIEDGFTSKEAAQSWAEFKGYKVE